MLRGILYQLLAFVFHVTLQVLVLKNLNLWGVGFGFAYVGFLLGLPIFASPWLLQLIGFATGLILDGFYNSPGVHTAACVALTFAKPSLDRRFQLAEPGGESTSFLLVREVGFNRFVVEAGVLVLLHHLVLFVVEAGGLVHFHWTLLKLLFSSLFTLSLLVIIQILIYRGRRRRTA